MYEKPEKEVTEGIGDVPHGVTLKPLPSSSFHPENISSEVVEKDEIDEAIEKFEAVRAGGRPAHKPVAEPEIPAEPEVQPQEEPVVEAPAEPELEPDSEREHQPEADETPLIETVEKPEEEKPEKGKKGKKIAISIIAVVLALIIGIGSFVAVKLNLIGRNVDDYNGSESMENDIDASDIDSITDAASLKALMKSWATNKGDLMHSKYVKNILLIGIDSDSKLSDSMILLSVNRRTEEISMVSFYRDSYTYMEDRKGNGYYAKLNAAYYYGGTKMVIDTIQNDYKIRIDDYALVGYDTFPAIIDSLGGVDVQVTDKEANYLNRTWKKWSRTGKKIQFKAGKMHMDGEHALMFCRIRKLDSDIMRTERQRRVITALMKQFKSASVSQINDVINTVLPNVKTSMRNTEILSFAKDAVTQGWLKYPMTQTSMPSQQYCEEGYAGKAWIWICDYEGAAYELQMMLYGQSNIKLSDDRVSALDFSSGKTVKTNPSNSNYSRVYTTQYAGGEYQTQGTTGEYEDPSTTEGGGFFPFNPNPGMTSTTQAQPQPQPDTTQGGGGGFWWFNA